MSVVSLLVFVHVMAAIVAFGPTYAYGIAAGIAEQEPRHIPFNNTVRRLVSTRLTVPGTIVIGVTGVALILVTGYPVLEAAARWLLVSIVLYVAAILYTVLVTRRVQRQIGIVSARLAADRARTAPAGGAGTTGPGSDPVGPRPAGPPPELAPLIHRVRRDGKAVGLVVVVIVFLMVVKPPFPF